MYPLLRLAFHMMRNRTAFAIDQTAEVVTHHRCLPIDLDFFFEMNNGRILSIYDIGRMVLSQRNGTLAVLRERKWGMVVAGSSVRYRKRIRVFQKFRVHTRCIGWDDRFLYIEQSAWNEKGECTSNVLIRTCVTDEQGMVPMSDCLAAWKMPPISPPLPEWVEDWIEADSHRPWPPEVSTHPIPA